jgi:hypothetical protein
MLSFQCKADVLLSLSLMADDLLNAVNAYIDFAPDPNCEALERFIRHLDDSGDMRSAVLSLGAALEHMVKVPAPGIGHRPPLALVYLLLLAMGNPSIAQHMDTSANRGKGH